MSRACGIVWCSLLNAEDTAAHLAPFREFRKPLVDFVGPFPMPVLNSLFDGLYPKGTRAYWKGDFFDEVPDEAIALHQKYGSRLPSVSVDHAPLSDRWSGGSRGRRRYGVGLPRGEVLRGHPWRGRQSGQ